MSTEQRDVNEVEVKVNPQKDHQEEGATQYGYPPKRSKFGGAWPLLIIAFVAVVIIIPNFSDNAKDAVIDKGKEMVKEKATEKAGDAITAAGQKIEMYKQQAAEGRILRDDPKTEVSLKKDIDTYSDPEVTIPADANSFNDFMATAGMANQEGGYVFNDVSGAVTVQGGKPDRTILLPPKQLYMAYFVASGLDPVDLGGASLSQMRSAPVVSVWKDGTRQKRDDVLLRFLNEHVEVMSLSQIELLQLASVQHVEYVGPQVIQPHIPILLDMFASYDKPVLPGIEKLYVKQIGGNPLKRTESDIPIQFVAELTDAEGNVFQAPAQRIDTLEKLGLHLIHDGHYRHLN